MNKRLAFLFPGQGSQAVGMGKDFFNHFTQAREVFEEGEELLQRSLSKLIFEGPIETLTETRQAQVAIYLTSLAILKVLQAQFPTLKPELCLGLSLGEYTALTACGKISFEKGLPLVQFRAEAMNAACSATQGGMAALFGLAASEVEGLVKQLNLPNDLWVANFNCPGQTVISGTLKGIEVGIAAAKERGAKRAIPLKVHGAFHSGLMQLAQEQLAEKINAVELFDTPTRLIMNATGGFVDDIDSIRRNLIKQVTSSVRWEQGIQATIGQVDAYLEIGCGKTLAGMNKQMGLEAPTLTVNTIEDLERVYKLMT